MLDVKVSKMFKVINRKESINGRSHSLNVRSVTKRHNERRVKVI